MSALIIVLAVLAALSFGVAGVFFYLMSNHKQEAREAERAASRSGGKRAAREAEESARKAQTSLILASVGAGGALILTVAVVALAANRKPPDEATDPPRANNTPDATPNDTRTPGTNRPGPAFDAEGLPTGNDVDSVLTRLNHRFAQNNFHLYQLETHNLRGLKSPAFARSGDVFRTLLRHAGNPGAQPQVGTIAYTAWQQALEWASKNEVPELCRMLRAEQIDARQSDLFSKLAEFKDPRCAEAVAPFLAVTARRWQAELLLKTLDATAERFVLPYLAANHHADTRSAALQVVSEIGTAESAKVVEVMTRDADLLVNHHAKNVFEKLSRKYGTEQDLLAAVAALKDGIAAQNSSAIQDSSRQLDKAYRADHPKRAEIFKRLIECCKVPDPKGYGKTAAFVGAMKWSSAADVAVLCELLIATGGESVVFLKLKEYKDPRTAETLAAFLAVPLKGPEAADALKAIGSAAERAVFPYTLRAYPNGAEVPFGVRLTAIDVLGDIGTADSVPLLRQLAGDPTVQGSATQAVNKIAARLKPR